MKISGDHFSIEIESEGLSTPELIQVATEAMDRKVQTGKWADSNEVTHVV